VIRLFAKKKNNVIKKRTLLQKIVNVFLYTGIILLLIFLIAFGFTQTSTFREYLRKTFVEEINKSLNGKLNIGKIDGTIFTSLVLRNSVISMGSDTLLNASIIEVKTSPIQIFLKRIYIRKFEIKDAKIRLISDSSGELNISKLFPPSPKDTSHSKFPFTIIAPDFQLTNIDFSFQSFNKANSHQIYGSLNPTDIRLKHLNLSLSASANIKDYEYEFKINDFSFIPNLKYFRLNKLSALFRVNSNGFFVNDLKLETGETELNLNLTANDFNVFDSTAFSKLNKMKLHIELNTEKFSANDIKSFIPQAEILDGNLSAKLKAEGSLKDLIISELQLDYLKTHLEINGRIKNILDAKLMNITASMNNSSVNEPDFDRLLPSLHLPVFKNLGAIKFDTLVFNGNPLNFKIIASLRANKGYAFLNGMLDFRNQDMGYNINLSTRNLDLSPFVGTELILNSKCSAVGSGISPDRINSTISFAAYHSFLRNQLIDSLKLKLDAQNKLMNLFAGIRSSFANGHIKGKYDLTNKAKSQYNISGIIKELNLGSISGDTSMHSNLNFQVDAEGDSFDPDKMNLYLTLHINKSNISEIKIDSARTIVDIRNNLRGERVINIISDLADITIEGKFSTNQAISFLSKESAAVSKAFSNKINQILYPDSIFNRQQQIGIAIPSVKNQPQMAYQPSFMKYDIEFKNFDLLSLLLGERHLMLNGEMRGEINNSTDSAFVSLNTRFDYIKYWSAQDVFFLSNLDLKLNLKNAIGDSSFKGLNSKIHLTADRIFAGSDIKKILLDFKVDNNLGTITFSSQVNDNANAYIYGNIDFTDGNVKLNLKTLKFLYNNFDFANNGDINIDYSVNKILFNNFKLVHQGGEIEINGSLIRNGSQDLRLLVKNIQGKDISTKLLGLPTSNSLTSQINIFGEIKGDFSNPLISLEFNADSLAYKNTYFGSIKSYFNYSDQNFKVNLDLIDSSISKTEAAFKVVGSVPIDLAFTSVKNRIPDGKQIDLLIKAADFKLATLGNLLPGINNLRGTLEANMKIGGSIDNLKPTGNILVKNADFIINANDLEYNGGFKMTLNENKILIDSLLIENTKDTPGGGAMKGTATILVNNFKVLSAYSSISGSLKVLSEKSKSVSPVIYGDLVLATNGNLEFTTDEHGNYLKAPLIVKEAKLTFAPVQSAYQSSSNNFIYRFYYDTTKVKKNDMDFESLVRLSESRNKAAASKTEKSFVPFNYSINIDVQNEATLKFILSRELNQSLIAVISGNFLYDNIGGKPNAEGELSLLDGSTLEFLKTFSATGTIRFEGELTNPYLNIVATYLNYYTPPEPDSKEEQVAVKINLNGNLKELAKNFIKDKNNVTVYVGTDNISNGKADPTKDISDAVMFVLTGKFSSDLTQQQQSQAINQPGSASSNAVTSTATSLAGSVIGNYLNHLAGDYVRNVELRSVGNTTHFNLVGKIKKFSYTIGGSTDVFSDLSQASVKIEYPIYKNLLLRVERKEAITQTTTLNEMVNELGLKFRFEF
jgi:hypothetical protein